jgi:hypothetical protein
MESAMASTRSQSTLVAGVKDGNRGLAQRKTRFTEYVPSLFHRAVLAWLVHVKDFFGVFWLQSTSFLDCHVLAQLVTWVSHGEVYDQIKHHRVYWLVWKLRRRESISDVEIIVRQERNAQQTLPLFEEKVIVICNTQLRNTH